MNNIDINLVKVIEEKVNKIKGEIEFNFDYKKVELLIDHLITHAIEQHLISLTMKIYEKKLEEKVDRITRTIIHKREFTDKVKECIEHIIESDYIANTFRRLLKGMIERNFPFDKEDYQW